MKSTQTVTLEFTHRELATIAIMGSLGASLMNQDMGSVMEGVALLAKADDADQEWDTALAKMEAAAGIVPATGMVS